MAVQEETKAGLAGARAHYAWVIVAVTFLALLVPAGVRTVAGVLILPWESEFGWDRAGISLAVAISLLTFGFGAPLAGSLIDRFGPRKVMVGGLAVIAAGLAPMLLMRDLWQLHALWGLIVGVGTGAMSGVLGATIATRWFNAHRGVIVGLFSSASSAGQLIFLPLMMSITLTYGWRASISTLAVATAALLLPVALFMRNRPTDLGLEPVGGATAPGSAAAALDAHRTSVWEAARTRDFWLLAGSFFKRRAFRYQTAHPHNTVPSQQSAPTQRVDENRRTSLRDAVRTRDFWLLSGSFFVCGYTSNGLIGTHLIPHAVEHGFTEVVAAGAMALMGTMNVIGTLASGWLTDRYDNRKLLAAYYGFRALSIAALPFIFDYQHLLIFAIVYGLDWIATVPPTVNLTAMRFGRESVATLYGWIFCGHMIGAALAAYAGGFFRTVFGDYHLIFISAALMGIVAVGLSMNITPARRMALAEAARGS